jgi:RHS repeat-associated protein
MYRALEHGENISIIVNGTAQLLYYSTGSSVEDYLLQIQSGLSANNISSTIDGHSLIITGYDPTTLQIACSPEIGGFDGFGGGYRYGFNGKEKDSENFDGAYDFGARILDARLGRWCSVDLLHKKTPQLSPYHSMGNAPIYIIDSDGNENIIYIVLTPKGKEELSKQGLTAESIASHATEMFATMHLKTEVRIFDGKSEDFEIGALDKSDAVAVIGGSAEDLKDFVSKELNKGFAAELPDKDVSTNPEKSENDSNGKNDFNGGNVITLNAKVLSDCVFGRLLFRKDKDANKNAETLSQVAAFFILHGAGHNSGYDHSDTEFNEFKKVIREPMMNSGDQIAPFFGMKPLRDNWDHYISFENNPKYVSGIIRRFKGHVTPDDNNSKNLNKIQSKK